MLARLEEWIICGARTEVHKASGVIRSSRKPDPHAPCSDTSMSKRRVLIVDDDVNLSRLSGMILENSGKDEVMT